MKSGSENLGERASKLKLPEVRRPEGGGDVGRGADGGDGGRGAAVDTEDARLARLERLGDLHEKGVLTKKEFEAEKARLLDADD